MGLFLKRLFGIAKYQLRLTLIINFALAAVLCALTPLIFGTRYLDSYGSSFVLERFVSLIGIVLLTPLFMPEHDKNIAELVRSKKSEHAITLFLRLLMSLFFMASCLAVMIVLMRYWQCDFEAGKFFIGAFASAFFLGVLGFTFSALTNNTVVGYLAAICYYLLNLSLGSKLNNFYLFSLSKGSLREKYWLLGLGLLFILASLLWKRTIFKKGF